jgi:acyl-CoA synthetase (NDP forming)
MTSRALAALERLATAARAAGRDVLLEHEGLELLAALGIRVPRHELLRDAGQLQGVDLGGYGAGVVLKVVAPNILHKSDVGGVRLVRGEAGAAVTREAVAAVAGEMFARFAGEPLEGLLLCELVPFEASLGHELLLGIRQTEDFGPVVTLGPGGIYTEFLAQSFEAGRGVAILSPENTPRERILSALERARITELVTGGLRGQAPMVAGEVLAEAVQGFLGLAAEACPDLLREMEINPLVLTEDGPVALDCLAKLAPVASAESAENPPARLPRPLPKIGKLLQPASIGIIGVSSKINPGRIILKNTLRAGFDPARVTVVKPGSDEIDGCRCVPDLESMPEKVDLFICAVSAEQTPGLIEELVRLDRTESMIVIPGGLEEREGSEAIVERMHAAIRASRETEGQGPVINGGNCLGVRSRPGSYDTLFIPTFKMPETTGEVSPVALLSQSGAFAVAQASKIAAVNPKYLVTFGNQSDLTIGDYLQHLKDDDELQLYACYVEGFQPGDGLRFLEAAREITAKGKRVLLYRSGRTAAGAQASASHTASIAGDYEVTRQLAEEAGVMVVEQLADFQELFLLASFLGERKAEGRRLGAISNAGFECVAIADNLGDFELASFTPETATKLEEMFAACRIQDIVSVHNPLDLTPIMGDELYDGTIRAVLGDPGVDAVVVGAVPLTAALQTLPASDKHREDFTKEGGLGPRLVQLFRESTKPFVVIVDAGPMYDPFLNWLIDQRVPCFRSADRALRLFDAIL